MAFGLGGIRKLLTNKIGKLRKNVGDLSSRFRNRFKNLKDKLKKRKEQDKPFEDINIPPEFQREWWEDLEPQIYEQNFLDCLFYYRYEHVVTEGFERYGLPNGFNYPDEWLQAVFYWNYGKKYKKVW